LPFLPFFDFEMGRSPFGSGIQAGLPRLPSLMRGKSGKGPGKNGKGGNADGKVNGNESHARDALP
jgi:hypothetical protein